MRHQIRFIGIFAISCVAIIGCFNNENDPVKPAPNPRIGLNQSSFQFLGKDSVATLVLSAIETDSIAWCIENHRYFVELSATSGIIRDHPDTVRLTVHRGGVPAGDQTALFDVIQLPDSQRVTVRVMMEVLPPAPQPTISDTLKYFPDGARESILILGNAGRLGYKWNVDYTETAPWLTVQPDTGSELVGPETLRVIMNLDAYPAGNINGSIVIVTKDGNTPLTTLRSTAIVTLGHKIAEMYFPTREAATRIWEGNWYYSDSAMAGGPGALLSLQADNAPIISDHSRISIQSRVSGWINVYPWQRPKQKAWMSVYIGDSVSHQSIDSTLFPWRLTTWLDPSPTPIAPGPLALKYFTFTSQDDCDGEIWLYSVEVWEK